MTEIPLLDKNLLKKSFARAAASYDSAAFLQQEICRRLLEKLEYIRFKPQRILDIGAGTGFATSELQQLYPEAEVIALDIAHPMLTIARMRNGLMSPGHQQVHFVNADTELLPLADNCIDFVFSNLTLQWVNYLDGVFAEFHRVMRPGGMLLFSTFGPDTLRELRASWQGVDQFTHVNQFIDMHDIGDALLRVGLAEPVMDTEYLTLTYSDVFKLMRDLKDIGAHNVTLQRSRGLTGKQKFSDFQQAYERYRNEGVLPATYEVVYGHAWFPEHDSQHTGPGSFSVPFPEIK